MGPYGPRLPAPPVYGTTGPRLDNNHIHRETHNANRKDAAYYGGVSTRRVHPGSPWRRASLSFFCQQARERAEFLFLRPPLKRRRIETLASTTRLSLSLFLRPLQPYSSPLFISSSTVPSFVPFDRRDPSTRDLDASSLYHRPPTATFATARRIRAG